MHCIFLSFYIILNIVHDNQKTLRNIKRGVLWVYCIVSEGVFSEYHLIKYEEICAPFAASFLVSCGRVPAVTKWHNTEDWKDTDNTQTTTRL